MLISKKELLRETGISYGQLYRWKREGLIPEEWFLKRPSFTGQETFFPKEKILGRIQVIQTMKDRYTLEELAKILSPALSTRRFTVSDLHKIEEIDREIIPYFCKNFEKYAFSYVEVLVMAALSKAKKQLALPMQAIDEISAGLKGKAEEVSQTEYLLLLLERDKRYFVLLCGENAEVFPDARFAVVASIRLHEISSMLQLKYKKSFRNALEGGSEFPLLGFAEGEMRV